MHRMWTRPSLFLLFYTRRHGGRWRNAPYGVRRGHARSDERTRLPLEVETGRENEETHHRAQVYNSRTETFPLGCNAARVTEP